MMRAIVSLALHRLRGRGSASLLLAAAVAAATGVASTIGSISDAATDTAVQQALGALEPGDRSIRITGFSPSNGDAATVDAAARDAFGPVSDWTTGLERGVIFRTVGARDPAVSYELQVLAVDGASRAVQLVDGRAPTACDGRSCEAILLSQVPAPADLPPSLQLAGLEIRIVGRGQLTTTVPVPSLDDRGTERAGIDTDHPTNIMDTRPALLLVDGVDALATSVGAAEIGRQYFWTEPLRTELIHPWSRVPLGTALEAARARLAAAQLAQNQPSLTMAAPTQRIDDQLARGSINAGRLLLVGSLGIAILLAFAAYSALLARQDLRRELERLSAAGGRRTAAGLLVALEAGIPTLAGGLVGWAISAGAIAALRPMPGAPTTLPIALVVVGLAYGAVLLGLIGTAGRQAFVGLLPGLVIAVGLVGWRLAAGLDPGAVATGTDIPILALLPAATGLAIAGLALLVVPRLLRGLARAGSRFGLPVRLALLSVARDPARPAATLTLLAFGLGGLVFAVTDAATLQQGIADRAAFATATDFRVTEAGTGLTLTNTVVPTSRYAALGEGIHAYPTVRVETTASGTTPLTLLGIEPAALGDLPGWRGDESASSAAALAKGIMADGSFEVPGRDLPADQAEIRLDVTRDAGDDPVDIWAVVRAPQGDAARIRLGTARFEKTTLAGVIPPAARGGRLIAFLVGEARFIAGEFHPSQLANDTLTFQGYEDVTGSGPQKVQASGVTLAVLRPPSPTDTAVLPAIVSPDLAALAGESADGTIQVELADRPLTRIRVAGIASRFPTIDDVGRSFAVVAIEPMLTALDGAAPGAGQPDEAWVRIDDPARHDAVLATLRSAPFRTASIQDRTAVASTQAADPFARSILLAFAAAAAAGLLIAALGLALGSVADLRDETGELRDLEAQGLGPAGLRRQVGTRTALLAAGGVLAGLAVGIALAAIVTGRVAVAADLAVPLPPLVLVIPWAEVALAVAVPLAVSALLAWLAASHAFRATARSSAPHATPRPIRAEKRR